MSERDIYFYRNSIGLEEKYQQNRVVCPEFLRETVQHVKAAAYVKTFTVYISYLVTMDAGY